MVEEQQENNDSNAISEFLKLAGSYVDSRLAMGEAYMYCNDCGARLYSFYGKQDSSRNCPKMKGNRCAYDD